MVQSLDPPGIAARDLRECLLAQLTPDMAYLRGAEDADHRTTWRTCATTACR